LQEQASNHLKLRWLRARVVRVEEKVSLRGDQVRFREMNVSEPLMRCRKERDDVKTGELWRARISPG
jgi:hypothetical protein